MNILKESNFISAIIYVHNNEKDIFKFICDINELLSNNFQKYEIICVNDNSSDSTLEMIKKASSEVEIKSLSVINMSFYQGVEKSLTAGVDLSIGDFVFEIESVKRDYDLNLLLEAYNKALTGYDIVSLVPQKLKTSSQFFYKIFNNLARSQNLLCTDAFRLVSRRAINRFNSISDTIAYRKVGYSSCGLNMTSIKYDNVLKKEPIDIKIKRSRKEKAIDAFVMFTDIAYKISLGFSITMVILMLISGIYTVAVFFSYNKPIEGWTPLMGLLSLGSFGLFSVLTMIIKYLNIILNIIFTKQKYLISGIDKIS